MFWMLEPQVFPASPLQPPESGSPSRGAFSSAEGARPAPGTPRVGGEAGPLTGEGRAPPGGRAGSLEAGTALPTCCGCVSSNAK